MSYDTSNTDYVTLQMALYPTTVGDVIDALSAVDRSTEIGMDGPSTWLTPIREISRTEDEDGFLVVISV